MKRTLLTLSAGMLLAGAAQAATISFADLDNSSGTGANNLNVGGSKADLTVVRSLTGGDYLINISYTGADYDGDFSNDTLSYTVRVSGMSGNTVSSSLISYGTGTSGEVALDGSDADVGEAVSGTWDLFGVGNNMASGETLIFTVENISVDVAGYTGTFDGFSDFTAQSSGASEALSVVGTGTGLVENYTGTSTNYAGLSETTLIVSSANPGSNSWGVRYLDYSFTVIPEPSSYALLAGMLGLSYVMLRRREA
ncbi:PEP-CTERM sorting domain-containing protein [Coraliomargarita algicola]|uniref:PEP-CTERM sorting domain-containing protein n=1 Tax=Coraliomargarita algicola TaxID=3092156 RepID=A0ABZ0RLV1_9BACT|nr:PEP-CTERM sorting domain-containing protein [Coraliomargarita sp. J2-16]WPJ97067.1 PEP-CTERM sorting domain-containing protein [Coraliomargarita sp. J2-16]